MDNTDGSFYTYGSNAEKLFKKMLPVLKEYDFLKNAKVYLRFIKENEEQEIEFKLSTAVED